MTLYARPGVGQPPVASDGRQTGELSAPVANAIGTRPRRPIRIGTMAATGPALRTVTTRVPARLDRPPWSRFHWRIVIGLGTVWILDGLEVTIVSAIAPRLTEPGSAIRLNAACIGTAAALYGAGECSGALLFGQLPARSGRKNLPTPALGVFLLVTIATASAFAPWSFFVFRFLANMGNGGEDAAIKAAID